MPARYFCAFAQRIAQANHIALAQPTQCARKQNSIILIFQKVFLVPLILFVQFLSDCIYRLNLVVFDLKQRGLTPFLLTPFLPKTMTQILINKGV